MSGDDIDWEEALGRARAESPFLARALDRFPELASLLARGEIGSALDSIPRFGSKGPDEATRLRRERVALSTALGIGDLAGALSLNEVVTRLSAFADQALDRAIADAIRARVDEPNPAGFVALALGKQGAGELNYSSDIDPILLYDPETLPRRQKDEPGEAAQRYARHLIRMLSENSADSFVFRVDLRLRPASEISPPAVSLASAQAHYESSALAWERAAFIRARAAAGDIAAGEQFLERIKSFVWRSNLDFGAIEEIRRLTAQIRLNYDGPLAPGPGFDLKKGRGGIREVEFFVQTHQLIHGGRDPTLRVKGTCAALDALAAAGEVEPDEAALLKRSYERLRTLEHRLQMVNDRQTHSLPAGEALDSVARLDGLADGAALIAELTDITEGVAASYDRLIGDMPAEPKRPNLSSTPVVERIEQVDRSQRAAIARRIERWRDGRYQSLRTPQALAAFDTLLPKLASAFAEADDPERAMTRWEGLLERASSAINLFHLLQARPRLLARLVSALSLAPTLADELGRRPELLDALIDRSALELPGSVDAIMAKMAEAAMRDDYEAQLDCIRVVTGETRFALGVQLIEAMHDPIEIAQGLSRTAEAAISVAVQAATKEFARVHGQISDGELLILGLGRLGGGVLTHASDLDLIYLFTGDYSGESDGERPLSPSLYFNRLAQRVSAALSVPTAQGALYEVDTRLRPQGNQGPLAVSVSGFTKYQREGAWTWEHMALARARPLVGSIRGRTRIETAIASVLTAERDPTVLRERVLSMRSEMAHHKLPTGELDVKLLRGGLVDLEFLIHHLQLRHGRAHPDLFEPDLGEALQALGAHGLIDRELTNAYLLLTRVLVAGRLLAPSGRRPPAAAARALARSCHHGSYEELLQNLTVARKSVAAEWQRVFDQELELG